MKLPIVSRFGHLKSLVHNDEYLEFHWRVRVMLRSLNLQLYTVRCNTTAECNTFECVIPGLVGLNIYLIWYIRLFWPIFDHLGPSKFAAGCESKFISRGEILIWKCGPLWLSVTPHIRSWQAQFKADSLDFVILHTWNMLEAFLQKFDIFLWCLLASNLWTVNNCMSLMSKSVGTGIRYEPGLTPAIEIKLHRSESTRAHWHGTDRAPSRPTMNTMGAYATICISLAYCLNEMELRLGCSKSNF